MTLIDRNRDAFVFGFTKLDVMFGRSTLDEVRLPYSEFVHPGAPVPAGNRDRDRPGRAVW